MNWLVRTLFGAMVAGVGWKMGLDVYETAKRTVRDRAVAREAGERSDDAVESGGAATEMDVVDISEENIASMYRWT